MGRERKFKAWDKNREKMIIEGGFIQVWGNGEYFVYHEDTELWESSDHIILEYIGLHDKKDNEICEGDILKSEYKVNGKTEIGVGTIKIHNGCACLEYFDEEDGHNYYPVYSGLNDYEIIGNIYENPELLLEMKR